MELDVTWNLGSGTVRAKIVNAVPTRVVLDFDPDAKPSLDLDGLQELLNYLGRLQQIMIVSGQ